MKLRIARTTSEQWAKALARAKSREIGGVLFGEHVGEGDFRLIAATEQRRRGQAVSFKRKSSSARRALRKLSREYEDNHIRYNYLGEWHSHPNVHAHPSAQDEHTMWSILEDPDCDANFLVLIIVRLGPKNTLELSATTYLASGHILACDVQIEEN